MTRTRRKKNKKKSSSLKLFAVFTVIAVVTIVLLEYIDFRKGQESFIFSKIIPLVRKNGKVERFNEQLTSLLSKNKISYDYFTDKEDKYHFKMSVDRARFDGLIARIKAASLSLGMELELAEIQGSSGKSILLYKVRLNRDVTHLLLITRAKQEEKKKKSSTRSPKRTGKVEKNKTQRARPSSTRTAGTPRIAFIIDDMGAYDLDPLELKQLDIPITASVLPDSRRARHVVHWLRQYRLNTIIHIPMQPTNSNGKWYDPDKVITVHSTDNEIRSLIQRAKKIVPIGEGVNNHEGSLVTSNREVMTRVLKIIKQENLFFVDSRTIGRTVAYDIAKKLNVRTAHKDIFLDHIQTYSHSMSQIRKLVSTALLKGQAIAIGHPFKTTIQAIRDSKDYIKSKGVKIVNITDLLE
jgi:polysaccharide deacetylase 2 family uncharacterized protein YibQ